jgi:hypothetical protein
MAVLHMAMAHPLPKELEDFGDYLADETVPRESGTRRAASPKVDSVHSEEIEPGSQRPTFRIPPAAGLAGYLDAPLRIDSAPVDVPPTEYGLSSLAALLELPRSSEAPPISEKPVVDARPTQRSILLPLALDPELAADPVGTPGRRVNTLRVHLTPYAREHAVADGDTDDTPAAMLEYLKLLGSFERVPYVVASMHNVMMEKLDHREGFVLSLIDGTSSIDTILDACPLSTHKTLRILHGLCERGILGLR